MRSVLAVSWLSLALAWAAPVSADDLGQLRITPWSPTDGEARPYRYVVELRASGAVEAVVDRRLLRFEVRPNDSRRRYRCRHPRAPRTASAARTRNLGAGEVWREWIDLRMYCTGRALRALRAGAEVRPGYGWRRATRTRWVARVPDTSRREWTAGLTPDPFPFEAVEDDADPDATRWLSEGEGATPITLELRDASAGSLAGLFFRVAVRARDGRERVYLRPDSFSFRVRGPGGAFQCRMPRWGGAPVPDLYRRVTERYAWRESLEATMFCPTGSFARAGVYEVLPKARLFHDGSAWELDAVTGRFAGPRATVRILSGTEGYVENSLEEPDDE